MMPRRRHARAAVPPRRFGVIDIGTNAVKLVVASVVNGRVVPHYFARRPTRLGERLASSKRISATAAQRTAGAVLELAEDARVQGATSIIAAGTYALRSATNAPAVVELIRRRSGVPVRVLSGRMEGNLVMDAVRSRVRADAGRELMVLDIGGGSVQLTVARPGRRVLARSVPLGAVVLTERYLRHDPIQSGEYARLNAHIDNVLPALFAGLPAPRAKNRHLVVAGGAATTALRMLGVPPGRTAPSISLAELKQLEQMCLQATVAERRRFAGMTPDRADIMPAGLAVLVASAVYAQKRSVRVFEGGWRDGLILERARRSPSRTRSTARVRAAARKGR